MSGLTGVLFAALLMVYILLPFAGLALLTIYIYNELTGKRTK